jgi:hypothetical protein
MALPEDNATPLVLTPRAENVSTLPASARFDQLNRVVLLAKEGLQRPDLSVMFQNVKGAPGAPETTIVMCENKLRNGRAAIRQLKRYAEKYGRDTPPCDSSLSNWETGALKWLCSVLPKPPAT